MVTLERTVTRATQERAIRTPLPEISQRLQELYGQKLTAVMCGIRDEKAVGKWARGERRPHPATEQRLRDAFWITELLMQREAPQTVRAWFMGINPNLDDRAPALALAEGRVTEVLQAAQAFLAGAW